VIVHDMPDEVYHRRPELSSTGARLLLDSPAKFAYAQTHPQPHKQAFDVGHAVHARVLGVGSPVEVLDFDSYRTKAAQDARDAAYAAGLVPMLAKDMGPINGMSEAVLQHPTARVLFEQDGGTPEASLFATDPETGVEMRARFDYFARIGVDFKTTAKSASKESFEKTVANFGYDVQEAWYQIVRRIITGEDNPFVFVVIETEPPHLIGIHQLDVVFRGIGERRARKALETYAECVASGVWPGHPTDVQLITPPTYYLYAEGE